MLLQVLRNKLLEIKKLVAFSLVFSRTAEALMGMGT